MFSLDTRIIGPVKNRHVRDRKCKTNLKQTNILNENKKELGIDELLYQTGMASGGHEGMSK